MTEMSGRSQLQRSDPLTAGMVICVSYFHPSVPSGGKLHKWSALRAKNNLRPVLVTFCFSVEGIKELLNNSSVAHSEF